jgi:hypothetical protein
MNGKRRKPTCEDIARAALAGSRVIILHHERGIHMANACHVAPRSDWVVDKD